MSASSSTPAQDAAPFEKPAFARDLMFLAEKARIAVGDVVIVFETFDRMQPVVVTPKMQFSGKYGNYAHDDFVGKPFGAKIGGKKGRGFVYLLRPTPELWTLALPHRTQILYAADIAVIVAQLHLKPGAVVFECGTGSGSLTTSLARAVYPTGHVYTYEFNGRRAELANEEFMRNGLTSVVTLEHRDVCSRGYGRPAASTDAVFLDVPAPWEAVPFAEFSLRPGGRICSFSPCIEQVERTCQALRNGAFTGLVTLECLERRHELKSLELTYWDPENPPMPHGQIKRLEDEAEDAEMEDDDAAEEENDEREGDEGAAHAGTKRAASASGDTSGAPPRKTRKPPRHVYVPPTLPPRLAIRPMTEMKGHSGFLTFATKMIDAHMPRSQSSSSLSAST
nr:tRNA (adenine(58)-N(1))-methyltransferase catalytic subunit [Seculamonas ecuadoriensis]